jgi:hypothetical protein
MDVKQTNSPDQPLVLKEASTIAAGFLAAHWKSLLLLYCLAVLPALLFSLLELKASAMNLGLMALQQLIYLLVLSKIASLALKEIFGVTQKFGYQALARICFLGMGLWLSYTLAILAVASPTSTEVKTIALFLIGPALYLNLRYYFFYVPPLLRQPAALSFDLSQAAELSKNRLKIILLSLVGPGGLHALASAIISGLSPDQRHLSVVLALDATSGLFFLLNAAISISLAIHFLPQTNLGTGLATAATARLSLQAPNWLAAAFQPNKGFVMLMLACLVWAGNLMRLAELPPAPTLVVHHAETKDSKLLLKLDATDTTYKFRGFHPVFFHLASNLRTPLADRPLRVTKQGEPDDILFELPRGTGPITLQLEFETNRTQQDLAALEDLFLWYRGAKIAKITFAPSAALEVPPTPTPSVTESPAEPSASPE